MRVENTPSNERKKKELGKDYDSGQRRCWFNDAEKQSLLDYYEEHPMRQVALGFMLECGCRVGEVIEITKGDFEKVETDDGTILYQVRITDSKGDDRTTPCPSSLKKQAYTLANTLKFGKNDPIVSVSKKTVQNWMRWAAEGIGGYNEEGNRLDPTNWDESDWRYVSAHDCRRTWGTNLVHSGVPESTVMRWGGWEDYDTFSEHYFGTETPEQQAEFMSRGGLM